MTPLITFTQTTEHSYDCLTQGGARFGELLRDVDGFFYYWPDGPNGAAYSQHLLLALGNKLAELNKPWEEQIDRDLASHA